MFYIPNKEVNTPPTHDQLLMAALVARFYEIDAREASTPAEGMLLKKMREAVIDKFLSAPKEVMATA